MSKLPEMNMRNYRQLAWCSCGAHAVCVAHYGDDIEIYLSLWCEQGMENHASFRSRLRDAWNAVRGKLYCDDVILAPDEAAVLAEALRRFPKEQA